MNPQTLLDQRRAQLESELQKVKEQLARIDINAGTEQFEKLVVRKLALEEQLASEVSVHRGYLADQTAGSLSDRLKHLRAMVAELDAEEAQMSPDWTPRQAGDLVVRRLGLESLIEATERRIAEHEAA